jgi:hypothetical protein
MLAVHKHAQHAPRAKLRSLGHPLHIVCDTATHLQPPVGTLNILATSCESTRHWQAQTCAHVFAALQPAGGS